MRDTGGLCVTVFTSGSDCVLPDSGVIFRSLPEPKHASPPEGCVMPKPTLPLIVKWRDLAEEGQFYADIAKAFPEYTASQVRHYCLGKSGARAPGPIQEPRRWLDNPWLQGEKSPHALLREEQVREVLDDWDDETGYWRNTAPKWAEILKVAPSTILAVRRGDTWKQLKHPNSGRKKGT